MHIFQKTIKQIIGLIFSIYIIQSLDFNINFEQPMTLSSPINFIKTTPNGRIIIHFQNKNWNVYDSLFNKLSTFSILNKTWVDLQIYSDSFGAILDQTRTQVCFFNLANYTQSTCNSMTAIIGIQPMNVLINYIAVANSTKFIAYTSFSPITFNTISPLVSFDFVNYTLGVGTVLNGSVYKMSYTFLNYAYSLMYSHSSQVKFLTIVGGSIVFTQDLNNIIKAYNLSTHALLAVATNLYCPLISIVTVSTNLMFIYSSEVFYVKYNTTNLQYEKTTSIAFNVSISGLVVIPTSIATLAYVPYSNVVYSVSQCTGNNIYNGTACVPYSCNDIHCNNCPISQKICSVCQSQYYINSTFACELSVLNSTNTSNSSQSLSNSTSNSSTLNESLSNYTSNSSISNESLGNSTSNSSISNESLGNSTSNSSISNESLGNSTSNFSNSNENLSNSSNSQNLSIQSFKNNKICGALSQLDSNQNCVIKNKVLSQIINFSKSFNGISSMRVLFQYFAPLYSFYDDYWYYIYHLYPSNSSFSYLYLVQLYNLNNERIMPSFAPTNTLQSLSNFSTYINVSNFDPYCPPTILQIDGQNIYFLQILIPMTFQNWMLSILIFLVCKLLFRFFNSIFLSSNQNEACFKVLKYLSNYFDQVSLKAMLIISLFQSNLIILSFRGTAQIFNSFSFNFIDKINIILVNFTFCLFIIYALSFYFLMTQCSKKKYQAYLDDKKSSASSFTIQFYLLGMKNLVGGVIHFIFLDSNNVFYLLFLLKACLMLICFRYRKFYKSQISMSFVIIYYLLGMIFDGFLIWSQPLIQIGSDISDQFYPQIVQKCCLFGFLIIILIKIIFDLGYQLKRQLCNKKNKELQEQQSKQKYLQKQTINKVAPFDKSQQMFGDAIINSKTQDTINPILNYTKKTVKMNIKKKFAFKITTTQKKYKKNQLKFTIFKSPSLFHTPSCQGLTQNQKSLDKNQKIVHKKQQTSNKTIPTKIQKNIIKKKMNLNIRRKKQQIEQQIFFD